MKHVYNENMKINLDLCYIIIVLQIISYIFLKQNYMYGNIYILWSSVIICFLVIFLQIRYEHSVPSIMIKVIIISLLLHALFIPQIGLLGSDSMLDFQLIEQIAKLGSWSPHLGSLLAPWPIIHIFIDISSSILGVSLLEGSRFIPSLVSVTTLLFIYSLSNHLYGNKYFALCCSTMFSILINFSFFHSLPVRETIGMPILSAALYCHIAGRQNSNINLILISILFGLLLVLCHHFTTLVYIIILFSVYFFNKVWISLVPIVSNIASNKFKIYYFLSIFVGSVYYWNYVSMYIFKDFVFFFTSLGGESQNVPPNIQIFPALLNLQTIIFSNSRRIAFVAIVVLLSLRILNKALTKIEFAFLSCSFFLFIVWILSNMGLIKLPIYPERLETFAWFLLLIVLSKFTTENFSAKSSFIYRISFLIFLISFLAMNVTAIQPFVYDPSAQPPYETGASRIAHLQQEYSAVNWFEGEGVVQGDRTLEDLLVRHNNTKVRTDFGLFSGDLSRVRYSNWIIIRMEMFKRIIGARPDQPYMRAPLNMSNKYYNDINGHPYLEKIYVNGEVDIYRSTQEKVVNQQ